VTVVLIPVVFRSNTDTKLYFGRLITAVVIAFILVAAPDVIAALFRPDGSLLSTFGNMKLGLAASLADSNPSDHVESVRGGLLLWSAHPIFGAGLGSYIHQHTIQTGTPLIIHNSALWIAAEMGVIGLCAYGFLVVVIGRAMHSQRDWFGADSQALLVGCLVVFGVMSLVHDMLYQRLLWLLLGAALASPCAFARRRLRWARDTERAGPVAATPTSGPGCVANIGPRSWNSVHGT
jgi:O-antigen ligase